MVPEVQTRVLSAAPPPGWLRVAFLGTLGAGALFAFLLFVYELALARVPQHRAALERLVRAQTGLDVRFNELGLRWGWYGPEAVFRRVELDEPGSTEALLRAPELVVGFDAWRTLRSGHPEAGRIELISPDIDFAGRRDGVPRALIGPDAPAGTYAGAGSSHSPPSRVAGAPGLDRVAVLQRWRGGRIDIEGGTLRLPGPGGTANPFTLQIRHASLRRSDGEWSVFGLVFLPDRLGRTARVVLRVAGDLDKPKALTGSLRLEAGRLSFHGCRDFLAGFPDLVRYLPRGGSGDVTVDLDFAHGGIVKAGGNVSAGGVVFDAPRAAAARGGAAAAPVGATAVAVAGPVDINVLVLDWLRGNWRVARHGSDWRIRVDSLELQKGERSGSLTIDTGESAGSEGGQWVRGSLDQTPLQSVVAIARWLAPHLDLAGIELSGTARNVTFDWKSGRPDGERLHTSAWFEDVALVPRSNSFTLSGLGIRVSGNESQLAADVQSRTARLELAQSRQYPLTNVHVAATLRISSTRSGWQLTTDEFLLENQNASLSLSGALQGDAGNAGADAASDPQIIASGALTGADIPFFEKLLGENTAQAFGAAASRLTAGRIQKAQFELRGPLSKLPFGGRGEGFTGSLILRDAIVSGADLWPDAEGIDAHVEWHGARIRATIEAGHAGPFQLASASADWDAAGENATRLTGHVSGRLEDAIAWLHDHPQLREYAPDVQDIDARGDAAFDINVSVPAYVDSVATARVSTFVDGARLQAVAGLPPMEAISGSFVFDTGRLQHSTLTGTWLGGPVTLRVGERREKGARVFAVQAQGTLSARQLANLANATGTVQGTTEWSGELAYVAAGESQLPRWRMRADSSLLGVSSSLPDPFSKRPAAPVPVHLEVTGTNESAQMRVSLGDRLRSLFALRRRADVGWVVDRGAVRFGTTLAALPAEPVVMIRGRLSQLDLPAYAMVWQRLRRDSLPTLRAQIVAGEMVVAGRSYAEVTLQAERTDAGTELQIDSAGVKGVARWPMAPGAARAGRVASEMQPAELHLTKLDLLDATLPSEGMGLAVALAPTALLSVDELNWRGRSLGRLTATVAAQGDTVVVNDVRLVSDTHDAHGTLRCQTESGTCGLSFTVGSNDAAATLRDFGFRPDVAAAAAFLGGDVEWQPAQERPWLASLRGTLSMRLADGTLRGWKRADRGGETDGQLGDVDDRLGLIVARPSAADGRVAQVGTRAGDVDGRLADTGTVTGDAATALGFRAAAAEAAMIAGSGDARPFALLAVPALVGGLDQPGTAAALGPARRELRFARLEADFELHDGQATTSNLHFDGDAEILMRGRTGLVSRDYDQQVWVLRGEERLPAAVRRFGATPSVAAAWLSLRELFSGSGTQDRSRAVLRLQGSWDDPMVVAAN